jgi:hypothetical protein
LGCRLDKHSTASLQNGLETVLGLENRISSALFRDHLSIQLAYWKTAALFYRKINDVFGIQRGE